jgi:hypothetical protein
VFCLRLVDLIGIIGVGGAERTFSSNAGWLRAVNGGKEERVLSCDVVCFRLIDLDRESAERVLSLSTLELECVDSHEGVGDSGLSLDILCLTLLDLNGSSTDKLFSPNGLWITILNGESEEELSLGTLILKVACLAGAEDGKTVSRDLLCFRLVDLTGGGR